MMIKPWYTVGCKTREGFGSSNNLARIHYLLWFLSVGLGLKFSRNHILDYKDAMKLETMVWNGRNKHG